MSEWDEAKTSFFFFQLGWIYRAGWKDDNWGEGVCNRVFSIEKASFGLFETIRSILNILILLKSKWDIHTPPRQNNLNLTFSFLSSLVGNIKIAVGVGWYVIKCCFFLRRARLQGTITFCANGFQQTHVNRNAVKLYISRRWTAQITKEHTKFAFLKLFRTLLIDW